MSNKRILPVAMILVGSSQPKIRIHQPRHSNLFYLESSSSNPLLVILLPLLLLCLVPCSSSCVPSERNSLLAFLSNLSSTPASPEGAAFPSWDARRDPDCCRWDGVTCDGLGSVSRLWLPLRGLQGPISADTLRGLPSLTHLNLSRNSLTGSLDPAILWSTELVIFDVSFNRLQGQVVLTDQLQLPSTAARRTLRLQTLDLSSNRFTGPLLPSSWWAGVPDLVSVNASTNEFVGSIPYSICAANRLQVLDLSFNLLDGEVPLGFGNCSQLRLLHFGYNNLSGQLPPDLYNAVSLQELSAPSNGISGSLDEQGLIANLANLSVLDLSNNELNGSVPESIGRLANLKMLMLNNNQLSGTLPSALSNCTRLRCLNLRNNNGLTGELSVIDFSKLSELHTLDLGFNNITGTLPTSLYSCKSLVALRLAKNNLTGRIEPGLARLQALSFISLSFNKMIDVDGTLRILQEIKNLTTALLTRNFVGEPMPQGITGLQSLRALSLARCRLRGPIPIWISQLKNVELLDLSMNQLTGAIPDWLGSLPRLSYLELSDNLLSGEFPISLTRLPMLSSERAASERTRSLELPVFVNTFQNNGTRQYNQLSNFPLLLNLQMNRLSGVIPPEIGLLKTVQILNLSQNTFSGSIPSQIVNLAHLESLDLSSNNLTGTIPPELSKLHFLSKFNVSHNQLWGPVPQGGQFGTFNYSSFEGNIGLCGEKLAPLLPCTDTRHGGGQPSSGKRKHINTKILGIILGICFVGAVSLVLFVLFMLSSRKTKQAIEPISQTEEDGAISDRSMPCFPQDKEIASCGPVVLFQENCQMESLTIADILQATDNFDQEHIIGCGGFGLVYKCALPNGTKLAIKRLTGETGIMEREFKAEVEALSSARHVNLVSLKGYFLHKNFRLLIYSLMENGSLDYWLHEKVDGPSVLNWHLRLSIAQGASEGLSYIHQTCKPRIIHRDIKSSNILLDHDLRAHIADFGLSRLMLPVNTHVTTELVGTLGYIPPEYGQAWIATLRGDIYSFGVVLLELLTGRRPYVSLNPKPSRELVGWVQKLKSLGKQDEIFDPMLRGQGNEEQMSRVLDIACLCVSQNPMKRPVIQKVVDWLHHVDARTEELNS